MKMVIAAVLATIASAAAAEPLELACNGEAIKTESRQTFASASNDRGESISGSATTYGRARSGERLRLKIDGAAGASIKLPPNLIPPLHSGGQDSWWPVTELEVSDTRISGSYRLNVLNKGHFVIDRHGGDIDVRALAMKFSGSCEKAEGAPEDRKF